MPFKPKYKANLQELHRLLNYKRGPIQGFPVGCKISLIHSVQEDRIKEAPDIIVGQLYSIHQICNKFDGAKIDIDLVIADSQQVFRLKSEKGVSPEKAYVEALNNGVKLVKELRRALLNFMGKMEKVEGEQKYMATVQGGQKYLLTFKLSMWNEKIFENLDKKYLPPAFDLSDVEYEAAFKKWAEVYPTQPLANLTDENQFSKTFRVNSELVAEFYKIAEVQNQIRDAANLYADNHKLKKVMQRTPDETRQGEAMLIENILKNDPGINEAAADDSAIINNSQQHFLRELEVFANLQEAREVLLYGIDENPSPAIQQINDIMRVLTTALFAIKFKKAHEALIDYISSVFMVFYFYSTIKNQKKKSNREQKMELEEPPVADSSARANRDKISTMMDVERGYAHLPPGVYDLLGLSQSHLPQMGVGGLDSNISSYNDLRKILIEKAKVEMQKLQAETQKLQAETKKAETEEKKIKELLEAKKYYYQTREKFYEKRTSRLVKEEEMSEASESKEEAESKEEEMSEQSSPPEGSQDPLNIDESSFQP